MQLCLTFYNKRFQGPIHVTELSLGDEFPIFSNARIRPSDDIGSMVRQMVHVH